MRKILAFLFVSLLFASVAMADTIIYPIGQAVTEGWAQGSGTGPTSRGWDFTITQPIYVQQLGVNAAFSTVIDMTLWDVTTQTLLASTQVTSQAYSWAFANLPGAIQLMPGDTYAVIGWADTTNDGQAWYIYNNTPPPEFNPTGVVNYLETRYDNGIGPSDFPTQTLGAPAQYGVTDIGYSTVPEPGTLALIGSGLGLVGVLRRKLNW